MVYYDYKFIIPDSPESRRKLRELGLDQIEEHTDPCGWYVGPEDIAEGWDGSPEELDTLWEEMIERRLQFLWLIEAVFPEGYLVVWGNKKMVSEQIYRVFKTNFWDGLSCLRNWVRENFDTFLEFGNDDLNGWFLVEWSVPDTPEIRRLIEICKDIIV